MFTQKPQYSSNTSFSFSPGPAEISGAAPRHNAPGCHPPSGQRRSAAVSPSLAELSSRSSRSLSKERFDGAISGPSFASGSSNYMLNDPRRFPAYGVVENTGTPNADEEKPPRYEELYTAKEGEPFTMPNGKSKLMQGEAARRKHMLQNGMNPDFIRPTDEQAGAIFDKKPIFVIDSSTSMNKRSDRIVKTPRKLLGLFTAGKKKKIISEPRFVEQKQNIKRLMRMTEAYSGHYAAMWNLLGDHLEGKEVSSVSSKVDQILERIDGATPLSGILDKIKRYEEESGDTNPLAIYLSTDGDPSDLGEGTPGSRLRFEKTVRDLTTKGITVQTPNGPRIREVGVSVQYIGDDTCSYKGRNLYTVNGAAVSRRNNPEAYYEARLADIRANGSTVAWLNALDNASKGGIPRFDVVDDDEAEIQEIKAKNNMTISKEDLDLKRAVGMWVPELDRRDESADSGSE